MAAQRILCCYPDYGKNPPEYVLSLMAALELHSVEVIAKMADLATGLPSKCKFPPTPADVAEFVEALGKEQDKWTDWGWRPPLLKSEPDHRQLETLEERKAFVVSTLGYDPANRKNSHDMDWCFAPPLPSVDIRDFPDTYRDGSPPRRISPDANRERDPRLEKPLGPFPERLLDSLP